MTIDYRTGLDPTNLVDLLKSSKCPPKYLQYVHEHDFDLSVLRALFVLISSTATSVYLFDTQPALTILSNIGRGNILPKLENFIRNLESVDAMLDMLDAYLARQAQVTLPDK
ncbi:hypothetical protein H2248_002947 [Termitomyces sp. 'cryptogamus']|nr:hypothetical protein H2248_002947 [Termitomyces sp. 'cryptogamus']